ncbi:MAG TPA: helix-turn-helix domain-containing protein [Spongiibacteraceae bacterium]
MSTISFTCGLDAALAVLGGKWKPLVLFHLAHGVHRYGELKRAVGGVSDKVLIQQLKELQRDEVIERIDYQEIPPKVEYSLTAWGLSLAKALAPLCAWGVEHMSEIERISRLRQVSSDADAQLRMNKIVATTLK